MTKKNTTLNMSLIPLFILIALILGAGYILIGGEVALPKFDKGPQIRRLENFPQIVYTDEMLEKKRIVIKSEEELNEFLNYIDPSGYVTLRENIDFNKEYLLAVMTETEMEMGHKIKVHKVYEDKEDETLQVNLYEYVMEEGCEVDQDKNVAVDIVAITKTDWNIEFDRVKKVDPCDSD